MSKELQRLEKRLNDLSDIPGVEQAQLFDPGLPLFIARAPGTLDVMGGGADYAGSLVLEQTLREGTYSVAQTRTAEAIPTLRLISVNLENKTAPPRSTSLPLDVFRKGGAAASYATASAYLKENAPAWAGYVAGAFTALIEDLGVDALDALSQKEDGAAIDLSLLIVSNVPEAQGVGASAALEVSTLQALNALADLELDAHQLALSAQQVEHRVVGKPSGVVAPLTCALGDQGTLLKILCQPAKVEGTVRLPSNLRLWGLDSGVPDEIHSPDHNSARIAAFMGYRIIADLAGLQHHGDSPLQFEDPHWGGYLANVTPSQLEQDFLERLPEELNGQEFIDRYRGFTDGDSPIEPARSYAIRTCTARLIYEQHRVRCFSALLESYRMVSAARRERSAQLIGELMLQSHAGHKCEALHSDEALRSGMPLRSGKPLRPNEADKLVQAVRTRGLGRGLYGAKLAGHGSGGTVVILGDAAAEPLLESIRDEYAESTGRSPYLFKGSSGGAADFGYRTARFKDSWRIDDL